MSVPFSVVSLSTQPLPPENSKEYKKDLSPIVFKFRPKITLETSPEIVS